MIHTKRRKHQGGNCGCGISMRRIVGGGCGCELPPMTGGGCSVEGFSGCPLPQTGGARKRRQQSKTKRGGRKTKRARNRK